VNEETHRIVEIGGIKVELDLRTAKVIETYRVGDPVRLLLKPEYSTDYKICPGFLIGLYPFKDLSSICVAYVDGETWGSTPAIKFVYINSKSKHEIAPMAEAEVPGVLKNAQELFTAAIDKKARELFELEQQRDFFLRRMGTIINNTEENAS